MKNNRKNRKRMIMAMRRIHGKTRYRVTHAVAARLIAYSNAWKSGKYDGGRVRPWQWVDRGPEPRVFRTIKMKRNHSYGAID